MSWHSVANQFLFALAWASFGIVHSALAAEQVKRALAAVLGSFQRVAYNLVASVHLAAILYVEWRFFPDRLTFHLPAWLTWAMFGLQAAGWLLLLVALAQYDMGRFLGLAQARVVVHRQAARNRPRGAPAPEIPTPPPDIPHARLEPLVTDGVHRFVRHPLYSALFMILWSRAFDEFTLATAVWASVYLVIGTRLEERKLIGYYGDAYRGYRERVPAYFPWRGRAWTGGPRGATDAQGEAGT